MRGKRATTEHINAVLKEVEAGADPRNLCRKHVISGQTLQHPVSFFRSGCRPR